MHDKVRQKTAALLAIAMGLTLAACDEQKDERAVDIPVEEDAETAETGALQIIGLCHQNRAGQKLAEFAEPQLDREILILVDQTTSFSGKVTDEIMKQLANIGSGGDRINIGVFSSYTGTRQSKLVFSEYFESGFPAAKENQAPIKALKKHKKCLMEREAQIRAALNGVLDSAMAGSDPDMEKSDIVNSVREFSAKLAASKAPKTTLIIVSDMLENSSVMSFYQSGEMRQINPQNELAIAGDNNLFASLPGSDVYLIGTGLIPETNMQRYRTIEEMAELKKFWSGYFAKSGAASVTVGTPFLVNNVQ